MLKMTDFLTEFHCFLLKICDKTFSRNLCEDFLRQKFLQLDALPNTNLYHRSGKWPIRYLLRQDGRSTIFNPTEHSCMQ